MESPILLSGQVTLVPGQKAEVNDSSRLQNPFRTPMFIDEIRFRIADALPDAFDARAQFQVELFLGRAPLTNGLVPFGNFSKLIQTGATDLESFTWKLPKPLFVPPNEYVIARVKNQVIFGPEVTQTVVVAYAGRSLRTGYPTPDVLHMPWAANFNIPAVLSGSPPVSNLSTEVDLVNPFNEPMFVQRFIGRGFSDLVLGGDPLHEFDAATSRFTTVRAVDSFGQIMVRDPTPFTNLFFYGDRSWTVNTWLRPKGFYLFQVDQDYSTISTPGGIRQGANISMLGYREVRLK